MGVGVHVFGAPVSLNVGVCVFACVRAQALEELSRFTNNENARMEKQAQEMRDKEDAEMAKRCVRVCVNTRATATTYASARFGVCAACKPSVQACTFYTAFV